MRTVSAMTLTLTPSSQLTRRSMIWRSLADSLRIYVIYWMKFGRKECMAIWRCFGSLWKGTLGSKFQGQPKPFCIPCSRRSKLNRKPIMEMGKIKEMVRADSLVAIVVYEKEYKEAVQQHALPVIPISMWRPVKVQSCLKLIHKLQSLARPVYRTTLEERYWF